MGAFDAHWDAIGAGVRLGDVVNVVGTSTCIMAIGEKPNLIPGVCGVVPGSVHPAFTGIEAGLSATGDIFDAIARRAGTTVAELSQGLENYRAGETGLLRLTWDNGDRTVLVNPELSGVTLGWRLTHTAQDELFAAIEGTAFHTRVILERMEEHGVPVRPHHQRRRHPAEERSAQPGLRQRAWASRSWCRRATSPAWARRFSRSWRRARSRPSKRRRMRCVRAIASSSRIGPKPRRTSELYALYRKLYFAFGRAGNRRPSTIGDVLPELRRIAAEARGGKGAGSAAN